MNNEQAINRIRERVCNEGANGGVYHICNDSCMYGEHICEFALAIKALEKQIPKKVKNREFECASCPECGTTVIMLANELENEKYCPQCGQALDWSEE